MWHYTFQVTLEKDAGIHVVSITVKAHTYPEAQAKAIKTTETFKHAGFVVTEVTPIKVEEV